MDTEARYELAADGSELRMRLSGDWSSSDSVPDFSEIEAELQQSACTVLAVDCEALEGWDSMLVVTLLHCEEFCSRVGAEFRGVSLPPGALKLMALSRAVAPHERPAAIPEPWWHRVHPLIWLQRAVAAAADVLGFVGEISIAFARLAAGRANARAVDFFYFVQQAGPSALGIITLISALVGMILAYLGSVQLRQIGAQIFVADLVGIGMVREMGPLMTAVIMAGRTGAAYAAQLGTMQTRDEIDAITTLGISPIEFLVLPRLLALVCIMPLLCLYSDLLGMLGGAVVALSMDVTYTQYVNETRAAVTLTHIATGVVKSVVFGLLIAIAGCRAGIRCGRSSEAVGLATTAAVVSAIVCLVIADAAFNILYQRLDI